MDYIYQDPDTEEMVQISLDEIVEFGEPSQIQTSLGDLTNLTFLPLPGTVGTVWTKQYSWFSFSFGILNEMKTFKFSLIIHLNMCQLMPG